MVMCEYDARSAVTEPEGSLTSYGAAEDGETVTPVCPSAKSTPV